MRYFLFILNLVFISCIFNTTEHNIVTWDDIPKNKLYYFHDERLAKLSTFVFKDSVLITCYEQYSDNRQPSLAVKNGNALNYYIIWSSPKDRTLWVPIDTVVSHKFMYFDFEDTPREGNTRYYYTYLKTEGGTVIAEDQVISNMLYTHKPHIRRIVNDKQRIWMEIRQHVFPNLNTQLIDSHIPYVIDFLYISADTDTIYWQWLNLERPESKPDTFAFYGTKNIELKNSEVPLFMNRIINGTNFIPLEKE